MSCSFEKILSDTKDLASLLLPGALGSGVVSWLGRSITNAGFLQGFGFGAVTIGTVALVQPHVEKVIKHKLLSLAVSAAAGGALAYGASAAAAAIGIVAAPITLTGALILTVSSIAFASLGFKVEECLGDASSKRSAA